MNAMHVPMGKFRMLSPVRSVQGNFILIGAAVGGVGVYPKRLPPGSTRDDIRRGYALLREQVHRDNPGVKEEFTMLRPKHSFN